MALLLAGCSDPASITDSDTSEPLVSEDLAREWSPRVLSVDSRGMTDFRRPIGSATASSAAIGAGKMSSFSSPLFGLTTAPDGDILVADLPRGVVSLDGEVDFSLFGISDVDMIGRGTGWAIVALTGQPGDDTGQSIHVLSRGRQTEVADLFAFESTNNPDGGEIDSNPFDVAARSARSAYVADAAANAVLHVTNRGAVEIVAVFPNEVVSTDNVKSLFGCPAPTDLCGLPPSLPAQPVPTSIAFGPDGYLYVGELKGFPAPTGESNIWRVDPSARNAQCGVAGSGCEKVFDGGFTSIIDLAFGPDGQLYVAELDESSWFAVELGAGVGGTISSCDVSALSCSEVAAGIPILTAVTFGKDGTLHATRNALIPGAAEVFEVN